MKKIASIILAVVLVASMFTMLGVTASAETIKVEGNSKTAINFTFEDGKRGFVGMRTSGTQPVYENGYAKVPAARNYAYWLGNSDSNTWAIPNQYGAKDGGPNPTQATGVMFKTEVGKTYTLELKYKLLAGATCTSSSFVSVEIHAHANPLVSSGYSAYTLADHATVLNTNIPLINWNGTLTEDTEWYTGTVTFTAKDSVALGLRTWTDTGSADIAYDYVTISEVVSGGVEFEYNVELSKDFTNGATLNDPMGISTATDGLTYGSNGMTLIGSNGTTRYVFRNDIATFAFDKKYYVSFDATAAATTQLNIGFGGGSWGTRATMYTLFSGSSGNNAGITVYVNGVETDVTGGLQLTAAQGKVSIGIVIDATSAAFKEAAAAIVGQSGIYFYIGNANNKAVTIGKLEIVSLTELDEVPAPADKADAKYSIRKNSAGYSAGLRFRGTISNDVKANADEIGFVVAPASSTYGIDAWYDIAAGVITNAQTAVSYTKGGNDVVYASDANTTSYQLVLTNIINKEGTKDISVRRFAAVMYVKTGDTYTYYDLGEISYKQVLAEYAVRGY